jgi:hypothetical protein
VNDATESAKGIRTDWALVPTVLIPLPVCPQCGHEKYDRVRTNANGDGSSTKLCVCRACGRSYKICCEFPESGNDVIWTG